MSEWKALPLGSLASIRRGIGYSDQTMRDASEEGLPYFNMKSFKKGGGFNKAGLKYFCGVFSESDVATKRDVLIANTDVTPGGDIIGVSADLPAFLLESGTLFSHHVTRIRPIDDIQPRFLSFLLCADHYRRWMLKYARGTTVLMLDMRAIRNIPIRFPSATEEQLRIAAILTSLDTAIDKTEALIEKHQQIKAGLMRDLFTRGVLPSGQLRPSREQAPELYRETAAGWFPEDWSAETLESLLAPVANNIRSGPFGSALLKHELVENGIPFLGIDNIHVEEFRRDFKRFVSARKFRELSRYRVRPRDVIITIMGTVGRCCVVPDDLEIALSSKHLWTMTFDVERVIPELIGWQLNHAEWAKAWFRRCVQGGVMDAIQSSTLRTLKLPLPGIDEQRRIFARYEGAQSLVQRSRAQLTKLQQQKLGLMQDLLTGKVRVNATEHGVPA